MNRRKPPAPGLTASMSAGTSTVAYTPPLNVRSTTELLVARYVGAAVASTPSVSAEADAETGAESTIVTVPAWSQCAIPSAPTTQQPEPSA
ncbi:hypothetical protein [Rhodococcus sp. T7]|uniref:hypothetical protein n=1 Tax=Rhodococcus sp. T7 TaxID=627444 RepID=UPI0013574308|nr:hypothetical protein [Rhodococcus sp. T7]